MKNRIAKIIAILIAIAAIAAFDICLRYTPNRLLIATGILLTIASVLVAYIDEKTRRSRKYEPIDYTVVKGIRVKERYCTLGEENLALLTLYNQSKRTTTVTVKVTFFNVAGRVLGTETQTIHGMVRGMEKHLCFRPGRDFHAFTYTLETAFYRGICHERNFRSSCYRVSPVHPEAPSCQGSCPIRMEVTEEYTGTQAIEVVCSYLLLDKNDRIYSLHTAAPRHLTQPLSAHTFTATEHDFPAEGNISLDEELRERGMQGLCVYTATPIQ